MRAARGGGCSVGTPPVYLGVRLVRDDDRPSLLRKAADLIRRRWGAGPETRG